MESTYFRAVYKASLYACVLFAALMSGRPLSAEPLDVAQAVEPETSNRVTDKPDAAASSKASQEPTDGQLPEVVVEPPREHKPVPKKVARKPAPASTAARPATPAPGIETSASAAMLPDLAAGTESTAPPPTGTVGQPPPAFPGGQVATGGSVGFLGNRNVFDTPFSMTSYTSELIQEQQATTIGGVLENNPSVRSVDAGFGVYDNFLIRGFPVTASVYSLNGLPGAAPAQMVAPEFIERVELFLGPSAMLSNMPLFGAVGGSINLVSKKARDEPLTEFTTGFLSDGQSSNHLDVGRRYGPNKEWGIRFNGVYRDGDTAIDDQQERLGLAALALDYHGRVFRTALDVGYQDQRWDAPFLTMLYNGPAGEVPLRRAQGAIRSSPGASMKPMTFSPPGTASWTSRRT